MKNDELFELLTDLPDELIEMSNPSVPFKRRRFRKSETFLMLIPAVLVSALLWKMHASDNMNEPDSGLSVTTPVTSVNEIYIQPTSENTVSELQPAVTSASTSVSSESFSSNTVSRDTSAVSASGSVYSEKEKKPDAVTAVTEVKEASPVTEINSTVTSVRLTEQTTPVVTVRPEADLEISVVKLFVEDSGYYRNSG